MLRAVKSACCLDRAAALARRDEISQFQRISGKLF